MVSLTNFRSNITSIVSKLCSKQGIGWFLRKAISLATVTLTIRQYLENSITHIDIQQTATGGIQGTTELRKLDWIYHDHKDGIFGDCRGKARWVKLKNVDDDEFLKTGWDDMEGEHVQSYVESKTNGWTADQVMPVLAFCASLVFYRESN